MKHNDSPFQVLAESKNGYIGVCECCAEFNFAFKTVLLTFQEEEMRRFFDWLISNRYSPEHYMPLRHGRNRMFSSPHSNLFLVYSDKEMNEINQLYNEALILMHTRRILSGKINQALLIITFPSGRNSRTFVRCNIVLNGPQRPLAGMTFELSVVLNSFLYLKKTFDQTTAYEKDSLTFYCRTYRDTGAGVHTSVGRSS